MHSDQTLSFPCQPKQVPAVYAWVGHLIHLGGFEGLKSAAVLEGMVEVVMVVMVRVKGVVITLSFPCLLCFHRLRRSWRWSELESISPGTSSMPRQVWCWKCSSPKHCYYHGCCQCHDLHQYCIFHPSQITCRIDCFLCPLWSVPYYCLFQGDSVMHVNCRRSFSTRLFKVTFVLSVWCNM